MHSSTQAAYIEGAVRTQLLLRVSVTSQYCITLSSKKCSESSKPNKQGMMDFLDSVRPMFEEEILLYEVDVARNREL